MSKIISLSVTKYLTKTLIVDDEEECKEIEITGTRSYVDRILRKECMTNEIYIEVKTKGISKLKDEFGNELIMELSDEKNNSADIDLQK